MRNDGVGNLQFVRVSKAHLCLGISRRHLHNLIEAGALPKPFSISQRVKGFLSNELDSWLMEKAKEARRKA